MDHYAQGCRQQKKCGGAEAMREIPNIASLHTLYTSESDTSFNALFFFFWQNSGGALAPKAPPGVYRPDAPLLQLVW